jgi:membrane protease YdiL (CAAX protease family)
LVNDGGDDTFVSLKPERVRAPRAHAKIVIVAVTSILFGLAHYPDQGFAGAVQATITGLAFGAAYLRIGSIWPVMVAHAAFDVAAVLIIYWNLEEPIGRLLLR